MHIRRARPEEAEALTELIMRSKAHWGYSQDLLDGWRPQLAITAAIIERDPVFCAEIHETLAGVAHLKMLSATEALLDDLFVEPAYMGRGVGARLWRHAATEACALGATTMVLDADIHAVPFYLRMGATLVDDADLADIPLTTTPRMRYTLPQS